ncbi:alpha/beta hydrolase fold domain-containing protein [Saccharopolyspora griseoalba]|uniref:Alpha/beta hydrolase fold domain-containing protein n=1 Tax=Saccharopolyspora griseoalba TaxID=1431848 RepID=A0ABW2LFY0_9PSEU
MTAPGTPDPLTEPLPAAVAQASGRLIRAVPYADRPGFRPLLADVHLPSCRAPAPVLLFVHGGGWRLGSRTQFCPTWADWEPGAFARLVDAGFAVISVDYRLSAEAVFPAQLEDVTAALHWIRTRAADLGVDADRIVAWGESAGAHLAALLGLTASPSGSSGLRGVVAWYGPSDLDRMASRGDPASREAQLLGAPAAEAPELARAASTALRAHAQAPPFHLAHGTADEAVPAAQSELLAVALRTAGAEVELDLVADAGHLWRGVDGEPIFERAVDFARRCTAS